MRIIFAAASLTLVAACGEGSAFDNSFKPSYVQKGVDTCVTSARQTNPAAEAQMNYRRLCTCMMERHIQGKTALELMQEREEQAGPAAEREMEQCINEASARGEIPGAAPAANDGGKPAN